MEIELSKESVSCNLCFSCTNSLTLITDSEMFRLMLEESPIEVTDAYLATLKACKNCATALKNISDFRNALVASMSANPMESQLASHKQEEDPDGLFCSICNSFKQEVYSASYLGNILQMLLKDSVEIPQTKLEVMECCDDCRIKLENIAEFQRSIVEEQLSALCKILEESENKEDISVLSPSQINEEDSESREELSQDEDQTTQRKIKTEVTPEGIKCDKCEAILKNTESYRKHQRRLHGPISLYCQECNKEFKSHEALRVHLKYTVKHAEKTHVCDTCGSGFFAAAYLEEHIKYKHNGEGDPCPFCGKLYGPTNGLRRHMRLVHSHRVRPKKVVSNKTITKTATEGKDKDQPKETIQCKDCGNYYKSKSAHQYHRLKVHGPIEEDAFCVTCNLQFRNHFLLKRHQKYSHNHIERCFQCSQCDKRFFTKPLLAGHIQYVHENKGHQCPICKKVCPPPSGLSKHMRRVHYLPKVRPQVCKICNKTIRASMKIHMDTHSSQKKYSCEPCNKSFNRSDALQSHQKSRAHLCKLSEATNSTHLTSKNNLYEMVGVKLSE